MSVQTGVGAGVRCDLAQGQLLALAEEYRDVLVSQARHRDHVSTTHRHIVELLNLTGAREPQDLTRSAVERALGKVRLRRGPGRPPLSHRTYNHYLTSLRSFCRWCCDQEPPYLPADPTRKIKKLVLKKDPRHTRRAMTDAELTALLDAAEGSDLTFYGLSGADWAERWHALAALGVREGTLRQVTVGQFVLDGPEPGLNVLGYQEQKRGEDRFVPLTADSAARIGAYLANKLPHAPAFPMPDKDKVLRVFRIYLAEAGVRAYDLVKGADGVVRRVNVVDVHSLRVTCGTRMARAGVAVKFAQEILGHSDPKLTQNIYSRVTHRETSAAIQALPPIRSKSRPA